MDNNMIDFYSDIDLNIEWRKPRFVECSGYDEEGNPTFFVIDPYDLDVTNLEKRTRVMCDILENPVKYSYKGIISAKYNRNQAISLANKCIKADRKDLSDKIKESLARQI